MSKDMTDPKGVLIKVLEIIEFQGDKEGFAHKLMALCHFQTCAKLLTRLEKADQEEIKKRLKGQDVSPKALHDAIMDWFSEADYTLILEEVSEVTFKGYFEAIKPVLNDNKKQELEQFIGSVAIKTGSISGM